MIFYTNSPFFFFFFNDTATTEIYTLSLHDALPISLQPPVQESSGGHSRNTNNTLRLPASTPRFHEYTLANYPDRKSTRLNSSHVRISYAVFCLKKKKKHKKKNMKTSKR